MVSKINVEKYTKQSEDAPIIDVRSPGEYEKGHIPGSINIPLFNNEERAIVGTTYVQESREKAIEVGTEIVQHKLQWFIDESKKIAKGQEIVVHCWRGGMRSSSFAEHIEKNGIDKVQVLAGGYKAFRNHVLNFFKQDFPLKIVGGYTGSGKTYILKELKKQGEQVIDLEGLAHHKGSAFGSIGESSQPTVEQFENDLYYAFKALNLERGIWLEDESHNIGRVKIPIDLFRQIRNKRLIFLDIPKDERAKHLVTEYSQFGNQVIADSIQRISKRLGGQNVMKAYECLEKNDYFEVARIALQYYDKSYAIGMNKREKDRVDSIRFESTNHSANASFLLNKYRDE